MELLQEIVRWALITASLFALVYLLSRVQMKGWLKEIDHKLGKQFSEYINNKKSKENDSNKTE